MIGPARGIREAAEAVRRHRRFILTTHVRPDGDACGASLGLKRALESLGKSVVLATEDPFPTRYHFLAGAEDVQQALPPERADEFDCAIAVDADGLDRVGTMAEILRRVNPLIDIDHHAGTKAFGDVRAVYSDAAASGELVYDLCVELGVSIDVPLATCLLTALTDDTGGFRHSNTSIRAHEIAAALIAAGADPSDIGYHIFGGLPLRRLALKGQALSRCRLELDGKAVVSHVTQEDFRQTGARRWDIEGIIDELRLVKGISVAVLVVETPDGDCKVSMRARGSLDVSKVTNGFGGGGHREAAGCEMPGPPEAAEAVLLDALRSAIERDSSLSEEI